ncbi:MAG: prolipoprotein diacylglyceryl transferase family protein [Halioglobus sp.]
MYPLIFDGYSTYIFAVALIAIAAAVYVDIRLVREGVPFTGVIKAQLLLLLGAWLGAKLFSLGARGWPEQMFTVAEMTGGLRFSGVIIGLMLALPFAHRWFLSAVSLPRFADINILAVVMAVAVCRVACMLAGCCTGAIGHSPLHFSYPPASAIWYRHLQSGVIENSEQWSQPVLALPLLFMAASLAVAIYLFRFDHRRHYDGQIVLLFLFLHELPKAGLELLRVPLIPGQLLAAFVAGLVGLAGLVYCYRNPPGCIAGGGLRITLPVKVSPAPIYPEVLFGQQQADNKHHFTEVTRDKPPAL